MDLIPNHFKGALATDAAFARRCIELGTTFTSPAWRQPGYDVTGSSAA
jgi:hypothetical protein